MIKAEPTRVPELVEELREMRRAGSVITTVPAVTGQFDLIALIESPDLPSLAACPNLTQ